MIMRCQFAAPCTSRYKTRGFVLQWLLLGGVSVGVVNYLKIIKSTFEASESPVATSSRPRVLDNYAVYIVLARKRFGKRKSDCALTPA
jgi:hypothetical protein